MDFLFYFIWCLQISSESMNRRIFIDIAISECEVMSCFFVLHRNSLGSIRFCCSDEVISFSFRSVWCIFVVLWFVSFFGRVVSCDKYSHYKNKQKIINSSCLPSFKHTTLYLSIKNHGASNFGYLRTYSRSLILTLCKFQLSRFLSWRNLFDIIFLNFQLRKVLQIAFFMYTDRFDGQHKVRKNR